MSVENKNVVDVVSINNEGPVVLTISDHLEWKESNNHILILQDKINSYLASIESGELIQIYPKAKGRKIIIEIVAMHSPNKEALVFLHRTKDILESAGYRLNFEKKL